MHACVIMCVGCLSLQYLHSVADELCGRDPSLVTNAQVASVGALELSAISSVYQQFFTFIIGQKITKERVRSTAV